MSLMNIISDELVDSKKALLRIEACLEDPHLDNYERIDYINQVIAEYNEKRKERFGTV